MVEVMAKKNNTKRKLVGLVSEESGVRAYYTKKNTMNTPDKLSLKKYDPVLRKHVLFVETKKNLGRNEVRRKSVKNNPPKGYFFVSMRYLISRKTFIKYMNAS